MHINVHHLNITLFKAITLLCGTDTIVRKIPHIHNECEEYFVGHTICCGIFFTYIMNMGNIPIILSIPLDIVMAMSNVMNIVFLCWFWGNLPIII